MNGFDENFSQLQLSRKSNCYMLRLRATLRKINYVSCEIVFFTMAIRNFHNPFCNPAPGLFSVQFASYELELKEKNSSSDAASTLLALAKNPEFEKEQQLWTEVETVLK